MHIPLQSCLCASNTWYSLRGGHAKRLRFDQLSVVIYSTAFPWQQWLRENASMLRCTNTACLVTSSNLRLSCQMFASSRAPPRSAHFLKTAERYLNYGNNIMPSTRSSSRYPSSKSAFPKPFACGPFWLWKTTANPHTLAHVNLECPDDTYQIKNVCLRTDYTHITFTIVLFQTDTKNYRIINCHDFSTHSILPHGLLLWRMVFFICVMKSFNL
jgi:hypothetical protein